MNDKHNEKYYEKCERCKKLDEINHAMKDQLQLQEIDLTSLNQELKTSKGELSMKTDECNNVKAHYHNQVIQLNKVITELQEKNERLNLSLKSSKEDNKLLRKEMQSIQAKLFESNEDLEKAEKEAVYCENLKQHFIKMQQESLILGELYERTKEKLDILTSDVYSKTNLDEEQQLIDDAYKREINSLESEVNSKRALIDGFKARINDMESTLMNKEKVILDYEQLLSKVKRNHETQLTVEKQRIESLERVNNRLEQHILTLYSQLGLQKHEERLKDVIAMKRSDQGTDSELSNEIEYR